MIQRLYNRLTLWNDQPLIFMRVLSPVLILLACLEVFAYLIPYPFRIAANAIWQGLSAVYLISSLTVVVHALVSSIRARSLWFLVTLFSVAALLFAQLGNPLASPILYEGLEQLGYVLNKPPGETYISFFHGYPTRQWLWPGMPSAVFGRSLLALQLGYFGLFMLGTSLLFVGLQRLFTPLDNAAGLAGIVIVGLLTFPILHVALVRFEQVEHPLIYGIHAMAWLLLALARTTAIRLVNTVVSGSMLCVSYTPAMAGALLLIAIMIYQAARLARIASAHDRGAARVWAVAAVVILTYFVCSFAYRSDLVINPTGIPFKSTTEIWCVFHRDRTDVCGEAPPMGQTLTRIVSTMANVNTERAIFPLWMAPLAGILMALGLLGRLGWQVFVMLIWLLLFTLSCGIASGFSRINPEHTLTYRLLLSLPLWTVLVVYMVFAMPYAWFRSARPVLVCVMFIGLLINAVGVRYAFARAFEPTMPNFLIPALTKIAVEEQLGGRSVDVIFATRRQIIGQYEMERLAMYFFPTWQIMDAHAASEVEPTNDTRLLITDRPPESGAARPLLSIRRPVKLPQMDLYFTVDSP